MATTLPGIRYTEATPSGRGTAVPLRLDVSTGAEHIARGIEALGEGFMRVAEAKRATDLSTKKRQFEEASFAAYQTYSTTGDPKAQETIEQKWSQDADKILSTDDPFLRQSLNRYKNEVLPDWGRTFANQKLAMQTRQVDDAAKINIQKHLELGAVNEAAKEIMNLQRLGRISQAESEQRISDLPNESVLAQAGKMIYAGNPAGGLVKLTELDMKTLSEPRTRYAQQLKTAGQQLFGQRVDGIVNEVAFNLHQNKGKNADERLTIAGQETAKLNTIREFIPSGEYRSILDRIEKFQAGEDEAKHPIAVAKFQTMATDIWRGAITKKDFTDQLSVAMKLSDSDPNAVSSAEFATLMKDADTELKSSQAKALAQADEDTSRILVDYRSEPEWLAAFSAATTKVEKQTLTDKRKLQFENLSQYNRELRDWLAANPTASPKELYQHAEGLRYHYAVHTTTEIQKTIKEREEFLLPKPDRVMRKTGESIADYLKRTGQ